MFRQSTKLQFCRPPPCRGLGFRAWLVHGAIDKGLGFCGDIFFRSQYSHFFGRQSLTSQSVLLRCAISHVSKLTTFLSPERGSRVDTKGLWTYAVKSVESFEEGASTIRTVFVFINLTLITLVLFLFVSIPMSFWALFPALCHYRESLLLTTFLIVISLSPNF